MLTIYWCLSDAFLKSLAGFRRAFLFMDNKYEYKRPEEKHVEVTPPSGNVMLFKQPSQFSMLSQLGKLPQLMANASFEKWKLGDVGDMRPEDQGELLKTTVRLTNMLMSLSVNPRLVDDPTSTPGELWIGDLTDEDCTFLLTWVASGGNSAAVAATFPRGRESGAVASENRHARRAKAKQASGVN